MIEEEQKQEDSSDSEHSMEDDDEELISFGLVEGRGTEFALSVEE